LGAEVGVEVGVFSKLLCEHTPNLKLYSIDPWLAYKIMDGERIYGKSQRRQEEYYKATRERLVPYKNCHIIRDSSMNAVKMFADESLDFVYIDANHDYKFIKEDIREWSKKVRKGGMVSGHDYYKFPSGNDGIIRAVDEWVKDNDIKPWFIFDKDRAPSWFYIKV
jgi:hypothetical protein